MVYAAALCLRRTRVVVNALVEAATVQAHAVGRTVTVRGAPGGTALLEGVTRVAGGTEAGGFVNGDVALRLWSARVLQSARTDAVGFVTHAVIWTLGVAGAPS